MEMIDMPPRITDPRRFSVSSTLFEAVTTGQIRPVATVAITSMR
jgi:hypothetical protein